MICRNLSRLYKRPRLSVAQIPRKALSSGSDQPVRQMPQTREEHAEFISQSIIEDPKLMESVLKAIQSKDNYNAFVIIRKFVRDFEKADKNRDGVVTFEEFRDWLNTRTPRSTATGAEIETKLNVGATKRPTNEQLFLVALNAAAPFVGFGFLDNAIMICAGSEIEMYFGASLGISAMAAAALGNTISDMAGIQAGGIIESASTKLGIRDPNLTLDQMKMNICRYVTILAQLLGIMVGCILGMFPLLFIEDEGQKIVDIINKQSLGQDGRLDVLQMKSLLSELLKHDDNVNVDAFFCSLGLADADRLGVRECSYLYKSFLSLQAFETVHALN